MRRRSRSSPTITTRRISRFTRTCSSRRTPRPEAMIDKSLSDAGSRRSPRYARQLHGARRHAGTIRARTGDWARPRRCRLTRRQYPAGRLAYPFHTRSRHGAERRPCRRERRDRGYEGTARRLGKGQPILLGRSLGRADPCRLGLGGAREGARDQALKFMRAAADGEDGSVKHVAMENRLYPMRELLGRTAARNGPAGCRADRNTRPRSRHTRTAIAGSGGSPRRGRRRRSREGDGSITASSWSYRRMPIPNGGKPGRPRHSWRASEFVGAKEIVGSRASRPRRRHLRRLEPVSVECPLWPTAVRLDPQCPLVAQSGHTELHCTCLLSGVKQNAFLRRICDAGPKAHVMALPGYRSQPEELGFL